MNASTPQLRIALLLGAAAALARLALLPYLFALKPGALVIGATAMGVPIPAFIAVDVLSNGLPCFLLAWAGLKFGASLGLGAPWLGTWLYGRPQPSASNWMMAALLGMLAAIVILGAVALFGNPRDDSASIYTPAAWKGLLGSFYGGVSEEIIVRVFVMGGIVWLLTRLTAGTPRAWVMIAAIIAAALLFGAGHLPSAAALGPLNAAVVTRVIAYNALAGLVFGALYWKRGLEHAMLAHFCADLVLHVIPQAIAGAGG
jgi:membrane protease YdiL (CAAX protease family)